MIAFEVWLNGRKLATVGVGRLGVLTGIVSWVRRDRPKGRRQKVPLEELEVRAGGLITDPKYVREHVDWVWKPLAVGDRVSFRVVRAKNADVPARRRAEDPQEVEKGERRYFEYLKRKYGRRPRRASKRAR